MDNNSCDKCGNDIFEVLSAQKKEDIIFKGKKIGVTPERLWFKCITCETRYYVEDENIDKIIFEPKSLYNKENKWYVKGKMVRWTHGETTR